MKRELFVAGLALGSVLLSTGTALADRVCPAAGFVELRYERATLSEEDLDGKPGKTGVDEFGDKIRQPRSAKEVSERYVVPIQWARVSAKSFLSATWRSDTGIITCNYVPDQDGVMLGHGDISIQVNKKPCNVSSSGNWVSEAHTVYRYDSKGNVIHDQTETHLRCSDDRKKCVWTCKK